MTNTWENDFIGVLNFVCIRRDFVVAIQTVERVCDRGDVAGVVINYDDHFDVFY